MKLECYLHSDASRRSTLARGVSRWNEILESPVRLPARGYGQVPPQEIAIASALSRAENGGQGAADNAVTHSIVSLRCGNEIHSISRWKRISTTPFLFESQDWPAPAGFWLCRRVAISPADPLA